MPKGLILTNADANAATKYIVQTQTHSHAVKMFRIHFLDANLTGGLYILRAVIPRCRSQSLFSCFSAEASSLGNTVINMQRCYNANFPLFLSLSLCLHSSFLPLSHLSSHLLSLCPVLETQHGRQRLPTLGERWKRASTGNLDPDCFLLFTNFRAYIHTLLELHAQTTLSCVFSQGFVSDRSLSKHSQAWTKHTVIMCWK